MCPVSATFEVDCLSLHGPAYDLSRAIVELASLSEGIAYHVQIDEAIFPDGRAEILHEVEKADIEVTLVKPVNASILFDTISQLLGGSVRHLHAGNVTATVDANGHTTRSIYDPANQVTVPGQILVAFVAKLRLYGFWRCEGPFAKLSRILEKMGDRLVCRTEF